MSNNRTNDIHEVCEIFGALANPSRLMLFLRLIDCCGDQDSCSTDGGMSACVGELAKGTNLAKSTVSHHLKELRRTGLISMQRTGRRVECSVNTSAIAELPLLRTLALSHRQSSAQQIEKNPR